MCDPVLGGAVALMVGSNLLSAKADKKVQSSRNAATNAELQRQTALQDRSVVALENTQKDFTKERQQEGINLAGDNRIQQLLQNVSEPTAADAPNLTGSAPSFVQDTAAQELTRGLASGKDFAKRLGRAGAFNANQFSNNVNLGRLSEQIGSIGRESFNSNQILPLELDSANRTGDKTRLFGDILGSTGSVLGLSSAIGLGAGAAGGAATSPYSAVLKGMFA